MSGPPQRAVTGTVRVAAAPVVSNPSANRHSTLLPPTIGTSLGVTPVHVAAAKSAITPDVPVSTRRASYGAASDDVRRNVIVTGYVAQSSWIVGTPEIS